MIDLLKKYRNWLRTNDNYDKSWCATMILILASLIVGSHWSEYSEYFYGFVVFLGLLNLFMFYMVVDYDK